MGYDDFAGRVGSKGADWTGRLIVAGVMSVLLIDLYIAIFII